MIKYKQLRQLVSILLLFLLFNISQISVFSEENNLFLSEKANETFLLSFIPVNELKPGDIAFKHPEAFPGPIIIDHCLLCVGYDNVSETYEFIEAHFHYGVQSRFEKKENLSNLDWGPYARVRSATTEQKQNAIEFARKQIGREFQIEWINKNYNPTDIENDSLAIEWYCSELIWAAYYNCNNNFPSDLDEKQCVYGDGIDIDMNGWQRVLNMSIVAPREMMFDNDVIRLVMLDEDVIDSFFYQSKGIGLLVELWYHLIVKKIYL